MTTPMCRYISGAVHPRAALDRAAADESEALLLRIGTAIGKY